MTQQSARLTVDVHTCWLPEVAAPVYPGPITLPPVIAPLPNPPLPYPDTTGVPPPDIIPADYCSRLIYTWLITASHPTETAVNLLLSVLPTAFDTLDMATYNAALEALIDQYTRECEALQTQHADQIHARQNSIYELQNERNNAVVQVDQDHTQAIADRIADMAACEAARYPDPPESGLRVRVSTRGASTSGGYNSSRAGLRTTCRLRLGAGTH